jgi:bifunctional UDP-N-acetylglucosamine pyrophosphorylase/glucosamine-1-phosphate N-acetyltransferase
MAKAPNVESAAAIVLAAGLGTRMKSSVPKAMHPLAGRPMILHLTATLEETGIDPVVVVVGEDMADVARAVAPHPTAVQRERLGTAHAVLAAKGALEGFAGDVIVLFGDSPLVRRETLERLLAARRAAPAPAVAVLGFRAKDPGLYGRLLVGSDGALEAIVEAADATDAERRRNLCNAGAMAIDGRRLFRLVERIDNDNRKREYYLTRIVDVARREGLGAVAIEGDERELMGIDSRADLAAAEAIVQEDLRAKAMAGGATLVDPETVHLSFDTRLGRDVTVGPHVVFGPGVRVGDGAEIRAFSHLEGAAVEADAIIGPFARLRPGAAIAAGAHVGNFVEIKQAAVGEGAKINHLSYVGDASVGAGANVGAGTITCNYDGVAKHRTDIGAGAFIGSNAALVAPVKVGERAVVGAGSVITEDVPEDALAVARAPQKTVAGWAGKGRRRKRTTVGG